MTLGKIHVAYAASIFTSIMTNSNHYHAFPTEVWMDPCCWILPLQHNSPNYKYWLGNIAGGCIFSVPSFAFSDAKDGIHNDEVPDSASVVW
jgi:hypothetical protein